MVLAILILHNLYTIIYIFNYVTCTFQKEREWWGEGFGSLLNCNEYLGAENGTVWVSEFPPYIVMWEVIIVMAMKK